MDSDQLLRRFERTAAAACVAMALIALALPRGGLSAAAAVVGGWLLIELALRAIRSGVDALARGFTAGAIDDGRGKPGFIGTIVKVAGRYALLGFLAYVMIARLRLPLLGLMVGASSAVAAASIEAVRLLAKK